jgi:hypothetical protein
MWFTHPPAFCFRGGRRLIFLFPNRRRRMVLDFAALEAVAAHAGPLETLTM